MTKKVILGGFVGAGVILATAFAILLVLNSIFPGVVTDTPNMFISLIPFLLAPAAGGFLAGLVGQANPLRAGLIAGVVASAIVFIAWLALVGFSLRTLLSGLVVVFVWIVLARAFSSFAQLKAK